jgi:hypothetical protein
LELLRQGKRKNASQKFLSSEEAQIRVVILAIVLECLQYLTCFLLGCSRDDSDPLKPPMLLDLLNPQYSPFVIVLQYIATLLKQSTDEGRLILLWRSQGCKSYKDWCVQQPGQIRLVRRSLLLVSGWVRRRHCMPLEEAPFCLAILIDDRAPDHLKTECMDAWDEKAACCVRPGFARTLKERGVAALELRQQKPLTLQNHSLCSCS